MPFNFSILLLLDCFYFVSIILIYVLSTNKYDENPNCGVMVSVLA